ncbi:hypothetical protein TNCV_4036001 [Trichonephila clavipes]|nr:hypothetical protein TNCV_4036001 [Trichonephila clavipes]
MENVRCEMVRCLGETGFSFFANVAAFPQVLPSYCQAYGDESLSYAHVFEWYKRISGGRVSVEIDETAGHPRFKESFHMWIDALSTVRIQQKNRPISCTREIALRITPAYEHCLVDAVALPSYPGHPRLQRDLVIYLAKKDVKQFTATRTVWVWALSC